MPFAIDPWTRLQWNETPIYLRADQPDWFVPNSAGDRLLRRLADGEIDPQSWVIQRLLSRLPQTDPEPYLGRRHHLNLDRLEEVWFHITDTCNLSCTHCLVDSSANGRDELRSEAVLDLAAQASELGCRLFAITGGEPFMHPQIGTIIDGLMEMPDARVVVMTNGTYLPVLGDEIARWQGRPLHFQLSIEGLRPVNDAIRGKGALARAARGAALLRKKGMPFSLSLTVTRDSVDDMVDVVDLAQQWGAAGLHLMWYFVRGRGDGRGMPDLEQLGRAFRRTCRRAEELGLPVDNLDALRARVFSPVGTIHDGTSAGWTTVAVGPNRALYPSPALVGEESVATPLEGDLARAWRESVPLQMFRQATVARSDDPLRFLLGGGDPDHSYVHAGAVVGQDPYLPMQRDALLWLIAREAASLPDRGEPGLRLKMGDVLESCGGTGRVALDHANCLLSLAGGDHLSRVREFYSRAARAEEEQILNPVGYPAELTDHIPAEHLFRGYGCGSPVLSADLQPGEDVVDLGSGRGVECFIAARQVGAAGTVRGVDMLTPMLNRARKGAAALADSLGYNNLEFVEARLEALPLAQGSVDVVLSNCVLNLSSHKRRTFDEIFRVLRPGGRLVVSDVVCDTEPSAAIRNDPQLLGECIAGALNHRDLFGILSESGFIGARVVHRNPYRTISGHPFYSLTYRAVKPGDTSDDCPVRVVYPGPLSEVVVPGGRLLRAGVPGELPLSTVEALGHALLRLDVQGGVLSTADEPTELAGGGCCCGVPQADDQPEAVTDAASSVGCCGSAAEEPAAEQPVASDAECSTGCCGSISLVTDVGPGQSRGEMSEALVAAVLERARPAASEQIIAPPPAEQDDDAIEVVLLDEQDARPRSEYDGPLADETVQSDQRHEADCMVCAAPLSYNAESSEQLCHFCQVRVWSNVECARGHFVCDRCHAARGLEFIERVCLTTDETDMVSLMAHIRQHTSINLHGPEHHGMVPGIILATYRNLGGEVTPAMIRRGIRWGSKAAGGFCGMVGACGAALGAGAAFSTLMDASPITPRRRQAVELITISILNEISSKPGARCCQRDSYIALRKAVEVSAERLPITLKAEGALVCTQSHRNRECLGESCVLWPAKK